ncbi:diguanylate cyclase domain-containing protein [Pseudemcibacter aquimaris]|uniref:bifunctional diguanylate cyclase/phosphodiesterase n=1 Tax=Pseudemcibacter aquimaris TaxID=2857064 RepID=UPI002010DB5D|nr:diguanylate cyclase [Pseudemcibacter aquimaris]MCC3861399.1 diguanylate cyclase [Pseudemcibacter aquimaris]WDU58169.1 diguanylate cyclase [Pseudemcibacter aquimaris]
MDNNIAHILGNTNVSAENEPLTSNFKNINFQNNLIEKLNGPAILTDESLNVIHKNIYADNLIFAFQNRNPMIHGLVIRALNNKCPEVQKLSLEDDTGTRHYDLFAFPVTTGEDNKYNVLLFGRDTTTEQQLTKALVDSRQMFKDLVSCSTDFAWETDNQGRFKYVSSNGVLGFTAYELNEKKASDLIVGAGGLNPFDTLDVISDVEIWMQRSDGELACIQVSATPVIDNQSTWQGARGVCRDVTEAREREAALRRIRKSEQTLKKIVSAMRDEVDPSRVLETTAAAAFDGITANHCYIASIDPIHKSYNMTMKAEFGKLDDAEFGDALISKTYEICDDYSDELPPSYLEEVVNGYKVLIGITRHHNKINGAIYIVLDKKKRSWGKGEKSLFIGVASHLGIALEQIKNYEKLEKLSNTDELTQLFNRRAFTEKVKKRLIIQKRNKHTCALMYIDLDNFKQANDTYGHAVGDDVLVMLSDIMKQNTRTEDLCCRMGGDEFAIWLENVDAENANAQATRILENALSMREIAPNDEKPLSLSIGITLSLPDHEHSLDELMEKADNALYDVKKNGKSGILLNR